MSAALSLARPPVLRAAAAGLAVVGLFLGYLALAASVPVTSDGASNVLQAWDMTHGNPLLAHWVLSDVSFYTTELLEQALLAQLLGLHPDVVLAGAALTYTLVVVLAVLLARGAANGRAALARMAVAAIFLLAPAPGMARAVLLTNPDHLGTAAPLLLTWLLVDRYRPARWLPVAVGGLLAWTAVGDKVVLIPGAAALAVVCGLRALRDRAPRGLDARLALAAVGSAVAAEVVTHGIHLVGGYYAQPVPTGLVSPRFGVARSSVAMLFGVHFPELHDFWTVLGVLRIAGVLVFAVALVVACLRLRGDRVDQLLAVGIVLLVAAYACSTLAKDLRFSREITPVLPLAAALVARICIREDRVVRGLVPAVAALVALLASTLSIAAVTADRPPSHAALGTWLRDHHLTYGLGGYWDANIVTVQTGGRVRVVAVTDDSSSLRAYRWETRVDWYDPGRHDARFVLAGDPRMASWATDQFGAPVSRQTFAIGPRDTVYVLVYDHNLLVGLPAWCGTKRVADSMAAC